MDIHDDLPKPEQIAWDMFCREALPAITGVMTQFICRQQSGLQTFTTEEATAVAKMVQLWTEAGSYFVDNVREEFPHIRDYQDIERLIQESRGPNHN